MSFWYRVVIATALFFISFLSSLFFSLSPNFFFFQMKNLVPKKKLLKVSRKHWELLVFPSFFPSSFSLLSSSLCRFCVCVCVCVHNVCFPSFFFDRNTTFFNCCGRDPSFRSPVRGASQINSAPVLPLLDQLVRGPHGEAGGAGGEGEASGRKVRMSWIGSKEGNIFQCQKKWIRSLHHLQIWISFN